MHKLWKSRQWATASHEEVVAALLDAPLHVLPEDMGQIKRFHPKAIVHSQSIFYGGSIPYSVSKIRQASIGF